jgi:ABC-2 type transport system ATP-binding protein
MSTAIIVPTTTVAPLALEHVDLSLAGRPVLLDVSLTCPAGQVTALLGPNGAGKSTTVAVSAGLRSPAAGQATVGGLPARSRRARTAFSLVPQDIDFPAAVTVGRCLDFVRRQRRPSELAPSQDEVCDRLGLTALLTRRIGGLSGGQRRKLAVALALVRAPGLVLLDEATTNLDELARATTWALIAQYVRRGGAALVTSHILADIESHADRLVALSEGRVVVAGSVDEVRARLGGSTVSVRLPLDDQQPARARIERLGLGRLVIDPATDPRTLTWRTAAPLELVAQLAALAPGARELRVRPTPLTELLGDVSRLADPGPVTP